MNHWYIETLIRLKRYCLLYSSLDTEYPSESISYTMNKVGGEELVDFSPTMNKQIQLKLHKKHHCPQ